ncbi:MAG: hypothetical protein M1822_009057 [Bathelium mastoideum]|nr:MAG: hypothetical protein M1822_009057 [Bathelium mastoideum]
MIRSARSSFLTVFAFSLTTIASVNEYACPLLGPVFPTPQKIDSSAFQGYAENFTGALEQALVTGQNSYGSWDNSTTSFSISVWSTTSNESLYEYHFEASQLQGAVSSGALNNDTIYRVGSVSKLFTVYTYLAAVGDKYLDEPITKYIPELARIDEETSRNSSANPIDNYRWSDITLRSIAAQLSGIVRDYGLGDYAVGPTNNTLFESWGLPSLNTVSHPSCSPLTLGAPSCTRNQFFEGLAGLHPVFTPYATPSYSNANFVLFAYALESILDNTPFSKIMQDKLLTPLDLSRSFYSLPSNSTPPRNSIVPFNSTISQFLQDGGSEDPAGSYYSTIKDMNALGRSILRSTLLPKPLTNHWLKPLTFTADLQGGVGMPYEIFRLEVPVAQSSSATRMVDLYTKSGDVGLYSTFVGLDPDHGTGFTVLVAGASAGLERLYLAEMLKDTFVPAFELLAAKAAEAAYAGTYKDASTNSSMTISTAADRPGLRVEAWTSRGVDMLADGISAIYTFRPTDKLELGLQPSGLRDEATGRVSFRLVPEDRAELNGTLFSCFTWTEVDSAQYGGIGIDEFVFELGGNGTVKAVEPRAFRSRLTKQ